MENYYQASIDDATNLLLHIRRDCKLSQEELSKLAGTSKPVICAFECRRRQPTLNWVKRVAGAMGYDVKFIMSKKIPTKK